jgi:signal transduction histidine kinase
LLRQLIAVDLYVPGPADFIVEKPESADPFQQPVVSLNNLAQYRRENSLIERVHVKGVVTLQRAGQIVFLQDETGGLQVKSSQLGTFNAGEVIEAVGFSSFEGFLPVLEDAVFCAAQVPRVTVEPKTVSIEELQNGLHHADFVSLQGKLMDRTIRVAAPRKNEPPSAKTTLVLETENIIFTAEADGSEGSAALASIPIGSTLKVSGICLMDIGREGKMTAFRVLIGSPREVLVLRKPSWLTPQRLLAGLGVLSVVLLVIVSWTIMVSRKNSVLKFLIQEREKAQLELQRAHDLLEEHVKERTEQLKFEITARKEAEVQFKGVLTERTRLAQELHDTLEQTLTGIGLQLDTAAKLSQRDPAAANHHLELSRNMMRQSQVELRRSVWDLRSRALEQFNLAEALRRSGRQITEGTGLRFEVRTIGQAKALPEVIEENLLRIGQEAVTNIVKHSGATEARIALDFGSDRVVLEITDNGNGFAPENCAGPRDGHFGLLGMSERAKRIGGQVSVSSAPGKGATVRIEIPDGNQPLHQANGKPTASHT